MYTRVYQGHSKELPEDYHGTAFQREETQEDEAVLFAPRQPDSEKEERNGEQEPMQNPPPPCEQAQEDARTKDPGATRAPSLSKEMWGEDLLLLVICALLAESDEPDVRLLALLLVLLLSPG